ncbi:hypothetical protein MSG28_002142 [Choristoneura fumiferana]|uniref:Uncharacterized protein n=1 Tax=Choristoneura fumiferana TaxID=7141 RepID=A0ACC0JU89_CHOFU|nr:hypothetical protein MSG28_002142 [Choristoneura fumiferana]
MVFYFTSNVVSPSVTLFMGADKHENEDLIKWGWPEDVWFHVDKAGQVAFHKDKDVRKVKVAKRNNEIVNRLNKTKKEAFPDLRQEREERDRSEREDKKKVLREKKEKEKEEEKRKKEEAEVRSYSTLMRTENMTTNYDGNDSDDFM